MVRLNTRERFFCALYGKMNGCDTTFINLVDGLDEWL
jgi:hypothetical protein